MSAFLIPDQPADDDLYNDAIQAAYDYRDGRITEEGYRLAQERYEAAEREHFERAWRATERESS
jgi:hypothetical protein